MPLINISGTLSWLQVNVRVKICCEAKALNAEADTVWNREKKGRMDKIGGKV